MSLNKFTDISTKKEWMNINCNEVDCTDLKATNATLDTVNIDNINVNDITGKTLFLQNTVPVDETTVIAITNQSELPGDQTYGFVITEPGQGVTLAKLSDDGKSFVSGVASFSQAQTSLKSPNVTVENALSVVTGLTIIGGGMDMQNTKLSFVGSSSDAESFYEVFTSSGNQYSGPWAAPIASEFTITRVGKLISVYLGNISSAASISAAISISVLVPASFRPPINMRVPINVLNNSISQLGILNISPAGQLSIFQSPSTSNFTASGLAGISGASASYSFT